MLSHWDNQYQWANGAVPRHYELQVAHYLSVMNLNTAYIACLFSNREDDFVWQKIERDTEEEENTILQLQDFWQNHVLAHVEPELAGKPDLVLEMLSRFYGPADRSGNEVELSPDWIPQLDQIVRLKQEKKKTDAEARRLERQIRSLYAPIADLLGTACRGVCTGQGRKYRVTYEPVCRTGISKQQLSRLKAQMPDVYEDYAETTESRIFKISEETGTGGL